MALGFAHCILSLTNGNIENLLGELGEIARTFGHVSILPHSAPFCYMVKFQTEALPTCGAGALARVQGGHSCPLKLTLLAVNATPPCSKRSWRASREAPNQSQSLIVEW